jgi:hypothetical protein
MRYAEITRTYVGTPTHPYVATIFLHPVEAGRFERMAYDEPSVIALAVDRSAAEVWTVYAACASEEVRQRLESAR